MKGNLIKLKKGCLKIIYIICLLIILNIIANINNVEAVSEKGLASLKITPSISELSRDEENDKIYRVKVSNKTTEVNVEAIPKNSNATIKIEGNKGLQVGTNKIIINIKEQDGSSENYVVYVRRADTSIASEDIVPNVENENIDNNSNQDFTPKNAETKEEKNILANNIDESKENIDSKQDTEDDEEIKEDKEQDDVNIVPILICIFVIAIIVILTKFIKKK